MYGPSYDSSRVWDNLHWIDHIPEVRFFSSFTFHSLQCILPTSSAPPSPGISSSVARVSLQDQELGSDGNIDKKKWWKNGWPTELTREKETRWTVTS